MNKYKKKEDSPLPNKYCKPSHINSTVYEDLQNDLQIYLEYNDLETLENIKKIIKKKYGLYISIYELLYDSINHFSEFTNSNEGLEYYLYSRGLFL